MMTFRKVQFSFCWSSHQFSFTLSFKHLEEGLKLMTVYYNRTKVKTNIHKGRVGGRHMTIWECKKRVRGVEKGEVRGINNCDSCGYGKLSHNREVPRQECRTDQPNSVFCLCPTWQRGPGHNIQQLPNLKFCLNAPTLIQKNNPALEKN